MTDDKRNELTDEVLKNMAAIACGKEGTVAERVQAASLYVSHVEHLNHRKEEAERLRIQAIDAEARQRSLAVAG